MNNTAPALPAIGSTVLEKEIQVDVATKTSQEVEVPYTVTYADARMVLGKRNGKGREVLLLSTTLKGN